MSDDQKSNVNQSVSGNDFRVELHYKPQPLKVPYQKKDKEGNKGGGTTSTDSSPSTTNDIVDVFKITARAQVTKREQKQ